MFKFSLPIQLLCVLAFVIAFGCKLDPCTINFFYSLSLTFKECLGFLLPFIVFSFICSGILSFKRNAPAVIGILLSCVLLSNATISLIAYFTSTSIMKGITNGVIVQHLSTGNTMTPLWQFCLPRFITSEIAMLCALTVGILLSYFNNRAIENSIHKMKQTIEWIMNTIFIPVLPLYVLGFLLEIYYKGAFNQLFKSYGKTFALIFALHLIVIFLIYFVASFFKPQQALKYINNALPSYLTAFGTMSSTAAIPVTSNCAEINTGNKPLAQVATPILANVHLLGDSISTPVLALTTLFLFQGVIPSIAVFMKFTLYFCLTMLAVSGVPGGGIIVMIPILKSTFGFSDVMISIIATLYLLQDAFGTAANVMGDGALMIIVNKLLNKLGIR